MATIDITQLRTTTQAAIDKGKEEEQRRIALDREIADRAAERQRILDGVRLADVLAQILPTVQLRASQGRSHAVIMDLKSREDFDGYNAKADGSNLRGVGLEVFDHCLGVGLRPTVEAWHDGIGVNGGEQIVAHW